MAEAEQSCAESEETLVDPDTLEDSLFEAVKKNNLDAAQLLLTTTDVDVNMRNNMSKTALSLALSEENVAMVQLLVDHGADINQSAYCHMYCTYETPVTSAARLRHTELVEYLLGHGCTLEGTGARCDGKTALQWAASHGDISMTTQLLNHGADVNWVGMYFHTALHYAVLADKPSMVQWLLENGGEISINGDGRTPLHIAAVRGNLAISTLLLQQPGCRLDVKDNFGCTAFSLACLRGHLPVLEAMVTMADESVIFDFEDGLQKASETGHIKVMEYLLGFGACFNACNAAGETPLCIAARGQTAAAMLLLEAGAIISAMDNRGYTALQTALLRDQMDIARALILHGASMYSLSPHVDSPLQIAFHSTNPLMVKYIVQAGGCLLRESWFTRIAVETRLRELEFQRPRHQRLQWDSDAQRAVWTWVLENWLGTKSLMQLCRIAVRDQLVAGSSGTSILPSIPQLPLPRRLQEYLTFPDVLHNSCS